MRSVTGRRARGTSSVEVCMPRTNFSYRHNVNERSGIDPMQERNTHGSNGHALTGPRLSAKVLQVAGDATSTLDNDGAHAVDSPTHVDGEQRCVCVASVVCVTKSDTQVTLAGSLQ